MRFPRTLAFAIALAPLALACNAARSDNPLLYGRSIPRAGVHAYPRAEHGGLVKETGSDAVEVVVGAQGRVEVYPQRASGQSANPRAVTGTVSMRADEGTRTTATLSPDPATGALVAQLPPPSGARTEYDLALRFEGRALNTGVSVVRGGTEPTLAYARSLGDLPAVPLNDVEAPPHQDTPGMAIGGGPAAP